MLTDVGSVGRRWVAVLALLSVVAAPAVGADEKAAAGPGSAPCFLEDGVKGAIVVRPAAALRRSWVVGLSTWISAALGDDLAGFQRRLKADPFKKGRIEIACKDVDWVSCRLDAYQRRDDKGEQHRRITASSPVVRMVAPFDWPAYLCQFGFGLTELKESGGAYYRITVPSETNRRFAKIPFFSKGFPASCVYVIDDRTIWWCSEESIKGFLARKALRTPKFPTGPEWDRASAGLVAVAIDCGGGSFLKGFDDRNPGDAVALSFFKGVERMTLSLADADEMSWKLSADCRPGDASAGLSRILDVVSKYMLAELDSDLADGPVAAQDDPLRESAEKMVKELLGHVRIEHTDHAVVLHANASGRLEDQAPVARQAKSDAKTEKR